MNRMMLALTVAALSGLQPARETFDVAPPRRDPTPPPRPRPRPRPRPQPQTDQSSEKYWATEARPTTGVTPREREPRNAAERTVIARAEAKRARRASRKAP